MSTLEVATDNLSPVLYKEIVEVISQKLKKSQKPLWAKVSSTSATLRFDIDELAMAVAQEFASSNKYPFENRDGTTYASIHMPTGAEKEAFSDQIQRLIVGELQTLVRAQVGPRSIEQFVTSLLKPIETKNIVGMPYSLEKPYPLEKRRLHLTPRKTTEDPWLKGHKLTLQVWDINTFMEQVMQGICNYVEQQQVCDKEDLENVRDALEAMAHNPKSPLRRLQDHITKQSLARIQREAKVGYLAYLHQGMQTWKAQSKEEGMKLLGNLVSRLRRIDTYIRQAKEDAYFQVTYQNATFNYRTLFSREDAYDMLPIIPEIEGFLGESTDQVQGSKTFISGLKLKLNGPVQIHGGGGRSVYQYYLALLNPESKEYLAREAEANSRLRFQEKVLKVALLYYFVFINMDDPTFDPVASFEREVLEVLRTGTEDAKVTALQTVQRKIVSCEKNISLLRGTLENFLDHRSIGPALAPKKLVLSLKRSILVSDIDSMVTHSIFFQEDFENNGGRDVLKYVAVEDANASAEALCKLPLQIIFEPMYYYEAGDKPETFTMTYETAGLQALPIFLAPRIRVEDAKKYNVIEQANRVMLYYRPHSEMSPDSAQAFAYRFTFLLLAYVFIKVLADSISTVEKRKLFLPILCLHATGKAPDQQDQKLDEETFMHALSKLLSHMLAEDYLSNSQGFHIDTVQGQGLNAYKLNSALYSLYTGLPRRFQLNQSLPLTLVQAPQTSHHALEKLAVIVVSSRKCDVNQKTPEQYQSTVFGEFIGIERLEGEYVRVGTLSTFSINQEARQMYRRPEAIIEQVKVWYALGYRHFLYIAQAPYSSTLHISDKAGDEELFFMNRDIIQAIRDVEKDIKIYPVFCDKYYVVNHRRKGRTPQKVDSLYIDDIGELSHLVNDPSKRSLVFFNLFSGASVRAQVYNGVMSYATLMNVYENDPTYDQYIWSDILGRSIPGSLKTELLNFLTLLHFARYEKPRDFGFKLDPYKRIIGDTSIGKVSIFPNMKGSVRFNALAFLTLVRAVLHAQR